MNVLKRGAVGFIAGIVVVTFTLIFFGILRGPWLPLGIALVVAIWAILSGKTHVSRFWLWFVIVFGAICVIPYWPSKSRKLLPFATPYVNSGFQTDDAILLVIHVAIAAVVAAIIHGVWIFIRQRHQDETADRKLENSAP